MTARALTLIDSGPQRAARESFGERARDWAGRFYPFDAVLFGLFVFDRVAVGPMPLGVALIALIGFLGFFRAPKLFMPRFGTLAFAYLAVVSYVAVVSELQGSGDWYQRAFRWALLLVIVWALVQGRFDAYSAVIGICTGLVLNALAYYSGLTSDAYPPFLTGFLGDKNVAGMWYAVFGAIGLALWRTAGARFVWLLCAGGFVFLTGSRTALSGLLLAFAWWSLRNRVALPIRIALIAAGIAALNYAEENLARLGVFSDRTGTDWFREQVDLATAAKLADTPWSGLGFNEAWVWVFVDRRQWFHDSYAAAYVEGGVLLLVGVVILYAVVAGGFLVGGKVSNQVLAGEAGIVVVLVCAWKLGEVFFTSAGFLALGIALAARYSGPVESRKRLREHGLRTGVNGERRTDGTRAERAGL